MTEPVPRPQTPVKQYMQCAQYPPDTGIVHPAGVQFGGSTPFPAIGRTATLLKDAEVATAPVRKNFHSRVFRLSIPEDKKLYDAVMQHVVVRWFKIITRIGPKMTDNGDVFVYLEWVQQYSDVSQARIQG